MKTNNYCVYLHRRKDNGEIFYIGSGIEGRRDVAKNNRSRSWVKIVEQFGFTSEIYKRGLDIDSARLLESQLIEKTPNIINTRKPVLSFKEIPQEVFEALEYSEKSPTFLFRKGTSRVAGDLSFRPDGSAKRASVKVNRETYIVSRVVWTIFNGAIPANKIVDHIDGNPHNNLVSNLRVVDFRENAKNRKTPSNSKSGVQGLRERPNSWESSVIINGVQIGCSFSKLKYGFEQAKQKAIAWRLERLDDSYTARHIGEIVTNVDPSHDACGYFKERHIRYKKTYNKTSAIEVKHPVGSYKKFTYFALNKYPMEYALQLAIELRDRLYA